MALSGTRARRLLLRLRAVPRDRTAADALAELGETDADGRRGARQQARLGEARQRVDLEAPETAVPVHAEVDAAVDVELQRAMHAQREILNARRLLRCHVRGEDLLGAAGLILRRVVEDRPRRGNDLADCERRVVENADRELAA